MNGFRPTPQQQQLFAEKLNAELEKMTMSWDNDLRAWHPTALHALNFTSAHALRIPQGKFYRLLETDKHGINMNVVMMLCNCLEERTPNEMGVTASDWATFLELSDRIAKRWSALSFPVEQSVWTTIQLEAARPKIIPGTMKA